MASSPCDACVESPVMHCPRCRTARCADHALDRKQRCSACERDWKAEAPTRRAAKMIFAPPIAILSGGLLFGLLLPISLGGMVGVAFMATFATATAIGSGAGACRAVDRGARAMFLRERSCGLPPARLLPAPRR